MGTFRERNSVGTIVFQHVVQKAIPKRPRGNGPFAIKRTQRHQPRGSQSALSPECPHGCQYPQKSSLLCAQSASRLSMVPTYLCACWSFPLLLVAGLGVPCGYGTSFTTITTNAQEEGSASSTAGTYGGSCVECPPGMECPGGGVFQECEPGTFAPGGEPSNVCMPCFPGSFASTTASAECTDCPAGKRSSLVRAAIG